MQNNQLIPRKLFQINKEIESQARLNLNSRCGRVPAAIRELPFPFCNFCAISSDADSCSIDALKSVGKVTREEFGLPMSDSFFPHYHYNLGFCRSPMELKRGKGEQIKFSNDFPVGSQFDLAEFVEKNYEMLKAFHRGRIDTVHGWLLRVQIRIGDDISLVKEAIFSRKSRRNYLT